MRPSPSRRSRVEDTDAARPPLLFLQNITGFVVGPKYEAGGILRPPPVPAGNLAVNQ
ncbi:MAG: hypothetical protein HRU33_24750 [Rhodobacteraceae bacterium]|nr:hypothetical protein [Paracoccaceae bacterium]